MHACNHCSLEKLSSLTMHALRTRRVLMQGRIQDFHLGGRKRLCARTHIASAEPNSLLAGDQGPLKGPGSSRVVLMLSRAI